jgi:outer membrane protein OmpA-like peptidoglycan-associated protein
MKNLLVTLLITLTINALSAQQAAFDLNTIPISKADLGTFPYFKTFPNFYARNRSDSMTIESNRAYFYDGKKCFSVDGKVSTQNISVYDRDKTHASEFQIIQEFDKIVATLGGVKVFTGAIPKETLIPVAGTDDEVALSSKGMLAPSSHYGVVEYVIKTTEKEVWLQLQPYSIGSKFYTLLVVEKKSTLLMTNTNKKNALLADLEKKADTNFPAVFEPDADKLLTESKDEILNIVGIFQKYPNWKLTINVHNAPIGKADYTLALTQKRAEAIKKELIALGVKPASIDVKGVGDTKPLVPNESEKARLTNTRIELIKN